MARSKTVEEQPPHSELVGIDEIRKRVHGLHQEESLLAWAQGLGASVWTDWAGRPALHVDDAAALVRATEIGERRKQMAAQLFELATDEWNEERSRVMGEAYSRRFAEASQRELQRITSDGKWGVSGLGVPSYTGSPRARREASEYAAEELAKWLRKNPRPSHADAQREAAERVQG